MTERRKAEEALRELADTLENQVRARTQDLEEQTVELVKQSEYIRNLSARMVKIQDEERLPLSALLAIARLFPLRYVTQAKAYRAHG